MSFHSGVFNRFDAQYYSIASCQCHSFSGFQSGKSERHVCDDVPIWRHLFRISQILLALGEFYWTLGRDISGKYPGKKRNIGFFDNLSNDLCLGIKNPVGLSPRSLKYSLAFYQLYGYRQQLVADNDRSNDLQQLAEDNGIADLMKIPWGHHIVIIGKGKGDRNKALFYVRKTIENGWSRTELWGHTLRSPVEGANEWISREKLRYRKMLRVSCRIDFMQDWITGQRSDSQRVRH